MTDEEKLRRIKAFLDSLQENTEVPETDVTRFVSKVRLELAHLEQILILDEWESKLTEEERDKLEAEFDRIFGDIGTIKPENRIKVTPKYRETFMGIITPGYKIFRCTRCGAAFTDGWSNDIHSPSGANCPRCEDEFTHELIGTSETEEEANAFVEGFNTYRRSETYRNELDKITESTLDISPELDRTGDSSWTDIDINE